MEHSKIRDSKTDRSMRIMNSSTGTASYDDHKMMIDDFREQFWHSVRKKMVHDESHCLTKRKSLSNYSNTCMFTTANPNSKIMWKDQKEYARFTDILKTISHVERVTILSHICSCKDCMCRVKDIYEKLSLSQPNVSRHLGLMKKQNIVLRITKGQKTYYTLNLEDPIVNYIKECLRKPADEESLKKVNEKTI